MGMTMRVSLPGRDVLTDGTIDHYSVYADSDNVLIKEFARGTFSLPNAGTQTITHNLGYVPHFLVYVGDITFGTPARWKLVNNFQASFVAPAYYAMAGTANIRVISAGAGGTSNFSYYIFYDQQV